MNMQGYSSVQALSHATNKVRMYLPYSPCKQTAVVKTLGNSLIDSDSLSDSLSMETKQLVSEFY